MLRRKLKADPRKEQIQAKVDAYNALLPEREKALARFTEVEIQRMQIRAEIAGLQE